MNYGHDTSGTSGASPEQRRAQAERESDAAFGLREALKIYRDCGGKFHGPHVEHASCEERAFHRFIERVIERASAARAVEPEGAAVKQTAAAAWEAYESGLSGYGSDDLLIVEHAFRAGHASAAPRSGRREGMLRAAEIAEAHVGRAKKDRSNKGYKAGAGVIDKERGEDIAATEIAKAIRAEADTISAAPRRDLRPGLLRAVEIAGNVSAACNEHIAMRHMIIHSIKAGVRHAEADTLPAEQPTDDGWREEEFARGLRNGLERALALVSGPSVYDLRKGVQALKDAIKLLPPPPSART